MSEPWQHQPQPQPPYGQQPTYGQPYGPPPYGPPPYGGVREHPQGTMILVLGILSLVICGFLGPIAWIMGNNALAEIDRNPGAYTNRGSVQAGRICGIIATVFLIIGVGFLVIVIAASSST